MKHILLVLIAALTVSIASCKKKGVCTCKDGDLTYKTFYEDLSGSEKRALKGTCNGDSNGKIVKTSSQIGGTTVEDNDTHDLNLDDDCEWSRTDKDE